MLGYESLIKKVKEDCKKGNDCFNEYFDFKCYY